MTIVNLTPHSVTFVLDSGNVVIPASGAIARLSTQIETVGEVNGIPVTRIVFGPVEGLPESKPDTVYIVSSLVAQQVPERDDVFIPSESVRDAEGRIIGCKSLGRI